ncbi:ECF-type sigma factor negative effector [Bacillus manliponensis]|uniref:ECF-type sigma factor negative effector n=1 Tax=Bacillus manliponensis TaxID=574376 RepID=A0A073JWS7_9BACI|nr:DUF4179 domain-containing protein [Bacillus manliponensis]KEK18755.1 ECF-type sigma factor negative effector [Bacillus manliponensis]
MKDVYELLHEVDIDESEMIEMEVSDFEKEKVKKYVKQSMKKKKAGWKTRVVAASIIVTISATTFSVAFPTYAGSLPIIGDVFKFLAGDKLGLYTNYKELSKEMNMTEESNGIRITVNDVVFDGRTMTMTYSMTSERDLGDDPALFEWVDIQDSEGMTGSSKVSKVDGNNYVGIVTASHDNAEEKDVANVKWDIEKIELLDKKEKIEGNWNFAFSVKATENKKQLVNKSMEQDGVKVNIEKLSFTPMSFVIYYSQEIDEKVRKDWDAVDVQLKIKDDLGNEYVGEGNGGSGKDSYNINWSDTFQKLNPNAKKLIVTPHITLRTHNASNHGGVEFVDGKEKKIKVPKTSRPSEEFVMGDIVIELEK